MERRKARLWRIARWWYSHRDFARAELVRGLSLTRPHALTVRFEPVDERGFTPNQWVDGWGYA